MHQQTKADAAPKRWALCADTGMHRHLATRATPYPRTARQKGPGGARDGVAAQTVYRMVRVFRHHCIFQAGQAAGRNASILSDSSRQYR
ncbi:MAG TPA: hypothetical protein DEP56_08265 [Pseudomonas sp.]|nr:hypothetical protein [Pseudomonas sp.]